MIAAAALPGGHVRLTLRSAPIADAAQPGQFLHIACVERDHQPSSALTETAVHLPLLRRPLGVHALHGPRYEPERLQRGESASERGDTLELLLKVVGIGTRHLAQHGPGDRLDVIGPLGRPFRIRAELAHAVIVAGGAGIAPLFFLAQELRAQGKRTMALVGAADEAGFPLEIRRTGGARQVVPLEEMGVGSTLVTEQEDGVVVTQRLEANLDALASEGAGVEIFACGPLGMLSEVARLAGDRIPCQVLLEERMCCGLGACRGCVTRVRDPGSPEGFALRTVCGDGPVFRAADVVWE